MACKVTPHAFRGKEIPSSYIIMAALILACVFLRCFKFYACVSAMFYKRSN